GDEEGRVDVAVAGVAEREADDVVTLRDLERLACDVAQAVERDGDVLAERAAALREDRERDAAAPAPELRDVRRRLGRVHGDSVLGERLLQLARDAARLVGGAVGL